MHRWSAKRERYKFSRKSNRHQKPHFENASQRHRWDVYGTKSPTLINTITITRFRILQQLGL